MNSIYELRHNYFVRERRWVAPGENTPNCETDDYDAHCLHLAIFKDEKLVGYLRALPWQESVGFMLDHEFRCLLSDDERMKIVRSGAVELSRLVLCPSTSSSGSAQRSGEQKLVVELLLKLLYHLSLQEGFRHFYIEVEATWLKMLRRAFGLPFHLLGAPYTFPDGTHTVLAQASLPELEAVVAQNAAEKFQWYRHLPE